MRVCQSFLTHPFLVTECSRLWLSYSLYMRFCSTFLFLDQLYNSKLFILLLFPVSTQRQEVQSREVPQTLFLLLVEWKDLKKTNCCRNSATSSCRLPFGSAPRA